MIYKEPDTSNVIFAKNSIPGKVYKDKFYGKDLLRLHDYMNLTRIEDGVPFLILSDLDIGMTGHIKVLRKKDLLIPLGEAVISVVGKE